MKKRWKPTPLLHPHRSFFHPTLSAPPSSFLSEYSLIFWFAAFHGVIPRHPSARQPSVRVRRATRELMKHLVICCWTGPDEISSASKKQTKKNPKPSCSPRLICSPPLRCLRPSTRANTFRRDATCPALISGHGTRPKGPFLILLRLQHLTSGCGGGGVFPYAAPCRWDAPVPAQHSSMEA